MKTVPEKSTRRNIIEHADMAILGCIYFATPLL